MEVIHSALFCTGYKQHTEAPCLSHCHTHTLPVKPLITNMLIFSPHVYPDRSIQLIQQLLDLDLKLPLTDRAPVGRHAHFTAWVEAGISFIQAANTKFMIVCDCMYVNVVYLVVQWSYNLF